MDNNNNLTIELTSEDRIMRFLRGEMTADEEQQFKTDLAADAELRSDAVNMARLAKGMKQAGEEIDDFMRKMLFAATPEDLNRITSNALVQNEDEWQLETADYELSPADLERMEKEASEDNTPQPPVMRPSHSPRRLWLSVAASIAIIICAGIGYRSYSSYRTATTLAAEYCDALGSGTTMRGAADNSGAGKRLEMLFANVRNGKDLDATLAQLNDCWITSTKPYYNDYTDYSSEIGWYLAIAYLKNNDRQKACTILEQLKKESEKDTAVYRKAAELLDKLQ